MPPSPTSSMRDYWDARADEDAFHFVDARLGRGSPDRDRFWEAGCEDLDLLLGDLGAVLTPADDVVEIGCGVGRTTRAISDRVNSVRALDVSERMLALARVENGHLSNVEWILGDGESLAGIESSSADVCYSDVVFQHIPDPEITLGYIAEMGRVLRPGGWAAFQVSNAPNVHRTGWLSRMRIALLGALGRGRRARNDPAWRGSAIDLDRLREVAEDADLDVKRIAGAGNERCRVLLRKRH